MKLRYYTNPREFHMERLFYILDLLRQVEERVVPVEVVEDRSEEDIYENDMKPQTRTIKENTGQTAAGWLKAGSGNLHVHSTLALVEEEAVQWITRYDGVAESLEYLLENEEEALEELVDEIHDSPKTEQDVINEFENSDVLDGEFQHEVEVGIGPLQGQREAGEFSRANFNMAKNMVSRRIDLVVDTAEAVWVIEAKEQLNPKAIGQVLLYGELYQIDNPGLENVRKAVISGPPASSADEYKLQQMESVLENYGVKVFIEERDF